jgi:hypothetical protein
MIEPVGSWKLEVLCSFTSVVTVLQSGSFLPSEEVPKVVL